MDNWPQPPMWLIVTPEQFKAGWIEIQGIRPIHHNFIELGRTDHGNIVVRSPQHIIAQQKRRRAETNA